MGFLYRLFGMMLYFLYTVVHNYGWAIVLFTIICKLIILPLNIKSTKSMREMQALQPELQRLQKKYKNNPDKLQQETMQLYKIYNVNPMGGCLPLLLQLPIIYALFGALREPAKYVFTNGGAEAASQGFLWIPNLANPDPYYILPILCCVFTYITQKFTMSVQPTGDASAQSTQKMMLYMMPLMIGFMAMSMPAGVSLYWVVQNIFTFIQQFIMMRKPVKVVSATEAEKKLEAYEKEKRQQIKEQRQMSSARTQEMMGIPQKTKERRTSSVKMTPASSKKVRKTITKIPQREESSQESHESD